MSKITNQASFAEEMLGSIRNLKESNTQRQSESQQTSKSGSQSFFELIKDGIEDVNEIQKLSNQKSTDLATGKNRNIHETMITSAYAGLSFNLLVQVRNKALEAYQEVMRMPV